MEIWEDLMADRTDTQESYLICRLFGLSERRAVREIHIQPDTVRRWRADEGFTEVETKVLANIPFYHDQLDKIKSALAEKQILAALRKDFATASKEDRKVILEAVKMCYKPRKSKERACYEDKLMREAEKRIAKN